LAVPQASGLRTIQEEVMSVARVTEIIAASKTSFDDAVKQGIERANQTLRNLEGAWIQDQKVTIKDGRIDEYRVNLKVTFILKD
jgi:flavin-binding protein dodecin